MRIDPRHRSAHYIPSMVLVRSLFQSLASLKASTSMHDAMAARVMRAPVGWFERTPLGRILNRFSSDIKEVDKDVMEALGNTMACVFSACAIVVVISYTVRLCESWRRARSRRGSGESRASPSLTFCCCEARPGCSLVRCGVEK